jgi:Ca-activated chloride channel family protein
MEGQPIQQAKAAMLQAIQALQDQDRFNVIAFNDQYRSLFGGLTEAEPGPKGWAMAYVQDLDADGGTEMLPALREALSETTSSQSVRQVVFLTDGAIANEDQLFQLIHQSLGDARLFTVGIGAAPNSYFMRKSAQFGRGSYTFISKLSEVSARMQGLLEQLRYPAMQSVTVDFSEAVTYFPEQLPDLYQGEPLSLVIRRPAKTIQLAVRGQRAGTAWQANVTLTEAVSQQAMGIGKLWARAQINQLLDEQHITGQHDMHRDAVIALALEHQLLTSYTSFVAVEDVTSRPAEQPLQSHKIPNLVPHGAQHFGYPATALGWQAQLLMGLVVLFLVRLFSLQTWRRS